MRAARGFTGLILVTLGLVALAVLVLPRFFGWGAYVVTSGSMSPTFNAGAVVVSAPIDVADVGTGMVITFQGPDGLTTHRIAGISTSATGAGQTTTTFTTQGDANNAADPIPLDARNVVGHAKFAVPYLGFVVAMVRTPIGAAALAAMLLFVLFTGGDQKKRATVAAVPEATPQAETVAVA